MRARIDEVTRLLVEKLLSAPTEQLKATADEEAVAAYSDALNRLFELPEQQSETDTTDPASYPRSVIFSSRDRSR